MCGIAGFFAPGRESVFLRDADTILERMAGAIRHRGPDDMGIWKDLDAGIGLAHRRLSIIDLSQAGHQPMRSASGRYWIVYNGEIYNYRQIREELQKVGDQPFRGTSDTEVLLAAVEQWGAEDALTRFNGMFAFALWDTQKRSLLLARDRFGEKPLYYGWLGETLVFGSELKAIWSFPSFDAPIDRDALALYFRFNCIPAPHSAFRGIQKLEAASYITFSSKDRKRTEVQRKYWSLNDVILEGRQNPWADSESAAIDYMDNLLRDAVRMRLESDVPLGAFLSGGLDSSLVVALMQQVSNRQTRTFTIGFSEADYDESNDARKVAEHLGTAHTELRVTPKEALDVIPLLPEMYDEPFSDSSQIPTHLVSKLARSHVTVALSGDAGDEIFGGYNRHVLGRVAFRRLASVPRPIRHTLASVLLSRSPQQWDKLFRKIDRIVPSHLRWRGPGEKLHKIAGVMGAPNAQGFYHGLVSHWNTPETLLPGASEPPTLLERKEDWPPTSEFSETMMALDTLTYLPNDILCKVDRASMSVSLESRIPYLDPRVVAFAWRLPVSMKIRDGKGKWILRRVLDRYVPTELVDRPKSGFGVPIGHWLRGPLKEWASDLLDPGKMHQEGLLESSEISRKWEEHLSGTRSWQHHLWDVLMFQAWLRSFKELRGNPSTNSNKISLSET